MARIRSVKPEFFSSRTVCGLNPTTRLTFVGLWTYCDDEGRAPDDARLVKAAVWPLDDKYAVKHVERDLKALDSAGLIDRYVVDGQSFLQVTNWTEHQRINRPSTSKFPAMHEPSVSTHGKLTEDSLKAHGALTEASLPSRAPAEQGKEQGAGNREQGTGKALAARSQAQSKPNGYSLEFEQFWDVYPRKLAKHEAFQEWKKRLRDTEPAALIHAVHNFAEWCRRGAVEQKYVTHARTWLHQHRDDDFREGIPDVGKLAPASNADLAIQDLHNTAERMGVKL